MNLWLRHRSSRPARALRSGCIALSVQRATFTTDCYGFVVAFSSFFRSASTIALTSFIRVGT